MLLWQRWDIYVQFMNLCNKLQNLGHWHFGWLNYKWESKKVVLLLLQPHYCCRKIIFTDCLRPFSYALKPISAQLCKHYTVVIIHCKIMKTSIFSFFGGFVMYGFFLLPCLRQNNGERVVSLFPCYVCAAVLQRCPRSVWKCFCWTDLVSL